MPSKTANPKGGAQRKEHDDLENYFLDEDFEDDPFGSPGADAAKNKRQGSEGLGIDEEVSVQKRAREPRVKLDETRLLSEKGIPQLRRRAGVLKLKGKGHEFSDASRLLSFYQLWLDDLFPKAKFVDALAMVEKAGHKKTMHKARLDWINEGKPTSVEDGAQDSGPAPHNTTSTVTGSGQGHKSTTPGIDNPFEEDDIYNATPQAQTKKPGQSNAVAGGEPDEDDLDALMAEAEAFEQSGSAKPQAVNNRQSTSIFGSARPKDDPKSIPVPDEEDDLDALMAEAEANEPVITKTTIVGEGSIFGDGGLLRRPSNTGEDELDALMAEEMDGSNIAKDKPAPGKSNPPGEAFADEEAAMAEMDGLW